MSMGVVPQPSSRTRREDATEPGTRPVGEWRIRARNRTPPARSRAWLDRHRRGPRRTPCRSGRATRSPGSAQSRTCTDSLSSIEAREAESPGRRSTATAARVGRAASPTPSGREQRRVSEYPDLQRGRRAWPRGWLSSSLQDTKPFTEQRLDPPAKGTHGAVGLIFGQAEAGQRAVPREGRRDVERALRLICPQKYVDGGIECLERAEILERQPLERHDESRHIAAGVRDVVTVPIERDGPAFHQNDLIAVIAAMAGAQFPSASRCGVLVQPSGQRPG